MKQQFNIYLAPELIASAKHRAIDLQLSLSDLTSLALSKYIGNSMENETQTLTLQPIVHVKNIASAVSFFEALGGKLIVGSRDGDWAQLGIGGAEIGLLARPSNPDQSQGDVELCFECSSSLHALESRLRAQGVLIVQGTADEAFGEQLQVATPDGQLIKINRIDREAIS